MTLSIVNGLGRNRTVKFGGATAASKRDSSAAQADSFAGANEKKMRRPAPVGMTTGHAIDREGHAGPALLQKPQRVVHPEFPAA